MYQLGDDVSVLLSGNSTYSANSPAAAGHVFPLYYFGNLQVEIMFATGIFWTALKYLYTIKVHPHLTFFA